MNRPFVVPFIFQSLEVIMTEFATKSTGQLPSMSTFYMFIQHRFKMEYLIAVPTSKRSVFTVVFHMLCYHFLRVEFSLTQIALEISVSMYFFVF